MPTVSLVSLDEIKTWIVTREGYVKNDAEYQALALQATMILEKLCRRKFTYQTYTEYFDMGATGSTVYDLDGFSDSGFATRSGLANYKLKGIPIDTLEDFKVYFDPARTWDATTELPTTNYWYDRESGILNIQGSYNRSYRTIKVTYTAGYSADTDGTDGFESLVDAPKDLKLACLMTISYLYDKKKGRHVGQNQKGDKDVDADYRQAGAVPSEVISLIEPYRMLYARR